MDLIPQITTILILGLLLVVSLSDYVYSDPIADTTTYQNPDKMELLSSRYRCPEGWILNSNSRKCFRVFNSNQSWPESLDFCREYGGDLASLHSQEDFILMKSLVSDDTWIGLNEATEGVLEWSDGSAVDFTSWASGEPNNIDGTENCVDLSKNANFDFTEDVCSDKKSFICEKTDEDEVQVYRCPQNWIMNSDSSKCFHVINVPQTWQESLTFCRAFGGDLASLHSEFDFVLAKSLVSNETWIGLNDLEQDGVMVWSDSSEVDYTSWSSGQPDNYQGNQSCVDLSPPYDFNFDDDNCYRKESFLCEKKPIIVYRCPTGWILNSDLTKCFAAFDIHSSWTASQTLCREFGGELASLHSGADLELVKALLSEDAWIGFNDIAEEGTWVWSDGSDVDFTRWHTGEPSNTGNGEDCGELKLGDNYEFNDDVCTDLEWFICQTTVQAEIIRAMQTLP